MVYTNTTKTLDLPCVTEGRRHGITITGAGALSVILEFRNGTDPVWRAFPGFDGTSAEVIFGLFFATSPKFRLNFSGVPSATYFVSVAQEAVSKF